MLPYIQHQKNNFKKLVYYQETTQQPLTGDKCKVQVAFGRENNRNIVYFPLKMPVQTL